MQYDFIIVGAGSAGCVMAESLSRGGHHTVLLVEAGKSDASLFVHMPRGVGRVMSDPDNLWVYQPHKADAAPDETERWVRGRMLGGSSSINGMVYNRGQKEDWDALEEAGCHGWGWSSMLPWFRSIEGQQWGEGAEHGTDGPLHISRVDHPGGFQRAVIDAGVAMGLNAVEDLNQPHGDGVIGVVPQTIRRGRRWSAAQAFLKRAQGRANLTVLTGAAVERIIFDGDQAVGIEIRDATPSRIRARREVILCAGALESPRLLQMSGIGPADILKDAGVAIVHESPDVGRNIIEHRCLTMRWRTTPAWSTNNHYRGMRLAMSAARWAITNGGPLAAPYADVAAFVRVAPQAVRPDAIIFAMPYSIERNSMPIATEQNPGLSINGYGLRPESRGYLAITGPRPDDPLTIEPNFMATPKDRAVAVGLVHFIRRMVAANPLAAGIGEETFPGSGFADDDSILEAWHRFGHTGYHLVGSCRMGSDKDSVVDENLRVRGVTGLRVMDCSIFPTMISGNTNGPVIAASARGAALVSRSWSNEDGLDVGGLDNAAEIALPF